MVHIKDENVQSPGDVIKYARQKSGLTMEELAEKIKVSSRYLYRIENEGKKPSYDVLYKLIRELSISPDLIFYPERPTKDSEIENLIRRLYNCDERSLEVIKATATALIETAPKDRTWRTIKVAERLLLFLLRGYEYYII